jgi:transcriptional regulator with XRE-family HTH domain
MTRYPDLATALAATEITQEEFAAAMGVSQACISRIVHGHQVPRPELAIRIARAARIPLDSFARGKAQRLAALAADGAEAPHP